MTSKLVLIVALALASMSAQAADFSFSSSSAQKPLQSALDDQGTSKFETLLDAYKTASSPAQLSDFENSDKTCVVANYSDPNGDLVPTGVTIQCAKVLVPATPAQDVPATPAQGPLFPAQPAHHVPAQPEVCAPNGQVLLMGDTWIQSPTADQLSVFSNQQTDKELIIKVAHNDQGIYSDVGDNVQISIRRKDNYFPFIVTNTQGVIYAGYCY